MPLGESASKFGFLEQPPTLPRDPERFVTLKRTAEGISFETTVIIAMDFNQVGAVFHFSNAPSSYDGVFEADCKIFIDAVGVAAANPNIERTPDGAFLVPMVIGVVNDAGLSKDEIRQIVSVLSHAVEAGVYKGTLAAVGAIDLAAEANAYTAKTDSILTLKHIDAGLGRAKTWEEVLSGDGGEESEEAAAAVGLSSDPGTSEGGDGSNENRATAIGQAGGDDAINNALGAGGQSVPTQLNISPQRGTLRNRLINNLPNKTVMDHASTEFQAHHLIPVAIAKRSVVLGKLYDAGFYDNNAATNGVLLPTDKGTADSIGRTLHIGSHPQYSAFVNKKLIAIGEILRIGDDTILALNPERMDSSTQLTPVGEKLLYAVNRLQDYLRETLLGVHPDQSSPIDLNGLPEDELAAQLERCRFDPMSEGSPSVTRELAIAYGIDKPSVKSRLVPVWELRADCITACFSHL